MGTATTMLAALDGCGLGAAAGEMEPATVAPDLASRGAAATASTGPTPSTRWA
jgi:hypothetical protein